MSGAEVGITGMTGTNGLIRVPRICLENHEISLPSLAEQHKSASEVEARTTAIDHLEAELDRQITRSNWLRQSTLTAAFAGSL